MTSSAGWRSPTAEISKEQSQSQRRGSIPIQLPLHEGTATETLCWTGDVHADRHDGNRVAQRGAERT